MKRKVDFRFVSTFLRFTSVLSALRCVALCRQPLLLLYHYVTKNPFHSDFIAFHFRTPTGLVKLKAFSPDDVVTLFIVFCRKEYSPQKSARIFVDFGSNIGTSAAYFLSRNEANFAYCYEPNRVNIERLKDNLKAFEGRYHLEEVCVGVESATVSFGIEETGVYGSIGLGREDGKTFRVQCLHVNDILSKIIVERSMVDFLKIDIEGLEKDVIRSIKPEFLTRIRQIQAETGEFDYQIPGFSKTQFGSIVRYRLTGTA